MLDKAKQYAEQLISKFPNSQYAANVKPKNSESKGNEMISGKPLPAYFDETYQLLMQHQYTEVLMRTRAAKKQYDNPAAIWRFDLFRMNDGVFDGGDFWRRRNQMLQVEIKKKKSNQLIWMFSISFSFRF